MLYNVSFFFRECNPKNKLQVLLPEIPSVMFQYLNIFPDMSEKFVEWDIYNIQSFFFFFFFFFNGFVFFKYLDVY